MNAKVYLVGLGGGALVLAALYYPLYLYLPGLFVNGWFSGNSALAWGFGALALLLLLVTGAGAARLCGLKGRRRAGVAGLLAGLIASLFAFIFIVNPAAGVWGNRDLLSQGLKPYSDNTVFVSALMDATLLTVRWAYLAFWASLLAGGGLGFLGGLAAGAGGKAGTHLDVLSVPMSIAGMLSAALVVIGSLSVFQVLAEITQRAADKVEHVLPYPSPWVGFMAAGTAFIYLFIWQFLSWLALRKASAGANARPLSWDVSGWVNGLMPVLLLGSSLLGKEPWLVVVGFCLSTLAGFPALWLVWKIRSLPRRTEHVRISARWLLVGIGVLFSLALVGIYIGGAGPALGLVMLPVTMLPSLIPLEAAAGPAVPVAGGLPGILKAHYLAAFTPGLLNFLLILIPILGLTAATWLIDWYGVRLAAWILARVKPERTPEKTN